VAKEANAKRDLALEEAKDIMLYELVAVTDRAKNIRDEWLKKYGGKND
jgi:hypothetical protein